MIEKQKTALDKDKKFGTISTDLSNTFDTHNHNIRIYNVSSGPHITCFSAVGAKKRENFE